MNIEIRQNYLQRYMRFEQKMENLILFYKKGTINHFEMHFFNDYFNFCDIQESKKLLGLLEINNFEYKYKKEVLKEKKEEFKKIKEEIEAEEEYVIDLSFNFENFEIEEKLSIDNKKEINQKSDLEKYNIKENKDELEENKDELEELKELEENKNLFKSNLKIQKEILLELGKQKEITEENFLKKIKSNFEIIQQQQQ